MICENKWCIYFEKSRCILSDISVDASGMCEACIQVSLTDAELQKQRRRQRAVYEAEDAE